MTRVKQLFTPRIKDRLKKKVLHLAMLIAAACAMSLAIFLLGWGVYLILPDKLGAEMLAAIVTTLKNPVALREYLMSRGRMAPWLFVIAQVVQVFFAPIPGQAIALAGGYIFGFWKGWTLTTFGLVLGSALAMVVSRILGEKFVRRVVPEKLIKRFDGLISDGGYSQFFMIYLLPALPDDAVCFIAGLTRLKLLPLTFVCLLGRAPGMAVLSFVGAQAATGLTWQAKTLFGVMMVLSAAIWLCMPDE